MNIQKQKEKRSLQRADKPQPLEKAVGGVRC